jgi:hypothetical protein
VKTKFRLGGYEVTFPVVVEFSMWGQQCSTMFSNEEAAWQWLQETFDRGWLMPDMIRYGAIVLHDRREILNRIEE